MKRLLMVLVLVVAPTAVIARPATQPSVDNTIKVVRGANGQKTYYLSSGIVIVGTRHRPNAVYVMERSRISYDWASLQARFVDRIKATVHKDPF
jgi:hypothetical protein